MTRRRAVENAWPYLAGVSVSAAYYLLWAPHHPIPAGVRDVLSASSRAASSLFGFLLATGSILVGIKNSWYKVRAKESGVYFSLVKRMFSAMWWCLVSTVLSIIGLSFDVSWKLSWYPMALAVWLLCVVTALATTIRSIGLFAKLFALIAEE
ncbi:MAG TPA: hypothetical protein VHW09_24110 [Bryobacteraceae bacterium]|nr:hypothetical protein [Bryobacteraceae bacterium]